MNPRKGDFEGILLVDKPQGITCTTWSIVSGASLT